MEPPLDRLLLSKELYSALTHCSLDYLMSTQIAIPSVGQVVAVRQRLYLVERVVGPVTSGDSTLVDLSCVDDDAQGQQIEVLWERELGPSSYVMDQGGTPRISRPTADHY